MRSVQKVSSYVIWKTETLLKKIWDTRNIVHRTMTSQSSSKQASWDLTQLSNLCWLQPIPVQHSQVLCFLQAFQNVSRITFNRILTIFEAFVPHFYLRCTHCIAPTGLLNIRFVAMEECWSLTQNLMQICWSTCSVILNVTATQDTCSLSGV